MYVIYIYYIISYYIHIYIYVYIYIYTFNTYNLSITIETNIRVVNFLDTIFDLINIIYKPYQKTNDNPVYINKNSNHPPTVLRQLAKSVSKRISETSFNEQIFKESIPI